MRHLAAQCQPSASWLVAAQGWALTQSVTTILHTGWECDVGCAGGLWSVLTRQFPVSHPNISRLDAQETQAEKGEALGAGVGYPAHLDTQIPPGQVNWGSDCL